MSYVEGGDDSALLGVRGKRGAISLAPRLQPGD